MERKYTIDTKDLYNLVKEGTETLLQEVDFTEMKYDNAEEVFQAAKKNKQLKEFVQSRKSEIKKFLMDPKNINFLNSIKRITPPPMK